MEPRSPTGTNSILTRWMGIADANTALESKHLLVQWLPNDQNAQPLRIRIPEN